MEQKIKEIIFGQQVRDKINRGVAITARVVGTTLGSKGRNVAIEKNWGAPVVIHDGVTAARAIVLKDPFENMAAQLVIDAAKNTNNDAGDGTTTATILTYAIVSEALKVVSAGTNPMVIRKDLDRLLPKVIKELERIAMPVKTFEQMKQIATISCTNETIGTLIATAIQKVGENGVVTVQESTTSQVSVAYKEGMEFPRGYLSPYMVTDPTRMETMYEGSAKTGYEDAPYVAILDEKMTNATLIKIMERIYDFDNKARVLLIAEDFDIDSINSMVVSRIRAQLSIVAVKAPDHGEQKTNYLSDIAVVTGGKVIGGTTGIDPESLKVEDIGRAEKIIVSEKQTIVIGGRGKKSEIDARIAVLKQLNQNANSNFDKDKAEQRLARLVGGVAVISVGAASEAEMREVKERVIDAVNATKAAVEMGMVPGGGVALVRASKVITEDSIAAEILKTALYYPLQKLVENVGVENSGYVVGKILESSSETFGYNVETEDYEDLVIAGILDPLKVTKFALLNAASVASILITTDSMVIYERENTKSNKKDDEGIGQFPS